MFCDMYTQNMDIIYMSMFCVWTPQCTLYSIYMYQLFVQLVEILNIFIEIRLPLHRQQSLHLHIFVLTSHVFCRPVRYYDNIVYRDIFTNIAIRYFLLAITITAIEILCAKVRGSCTKY